MDHTIAKILLTSSYFVNLIALLVRDILWLRSILMGAQMFMIISSVVRLLSLKPGYAEIFLIANSIFFIINTFQVIRLLLERRPISLPDNLREIYTNLFSVMSRREFLYFWNTGKVNEIKKDFMVQEGEVPKELILIVNGTVSIQKAGREIAKRKRGSFVAEMSFMTGEKASADACPIDTVEYIGWDQDKLSNLKLANPDLMIKIQAILGKDLTKKLKQKH